MVLSTVTHRSIHPATFRWHWQAPAERARHSEAVEAQLAAAVMGLEVEVAVERAAASRAAAAMEVAAVGAGGRVEMGCSEAGGKGTAEVAKTAG